MKKVQKERETVEEIDDALTRSMSAKGMLAMAKRTAKAAQTSLVRVVEKARTKRAAGVAKESILRDLEGFDRELRKIDPPVAGSQSGGAAPKRKRERVRVDWNRYLPGGQNPEDNATS